MNPAKPSPAKPFQFTGWHFLACLVVFFGVDIAINVGFIVQSVVTFPGEVADDAYEAGVAYDSTLAREAIEQKLGWLATVERPQAAPGGEALTVRWTDRTGRPLLGLTVTGQLRRPATESQNLSLQFSEVVPGTYRAVVPVAPGAWDLDVTGVNAHGDRRTADRRLLWR
jgi:nitrogen fixation protein FixH